MCGIGGFISNNTNFLNTKNNRENLLSNLFTVLTLRGIDGTGIAEVDYINNDVDYFKTTDNAVSFIRSKDINDYTSKINNKNIGYILHTRATTSGGNRRKASHPFDYSNVIGVHNGTLYDWSKFKSNAISDSDALYYAINEADDPIKVLEKVDGAYALVWYNKTNNKFYFARNDQRTLYFLKTNDLIIFSSEFEMINFAITRALGNKQYKEIVTNSSNEYEFEEMTLYELDPIEMSFTKTKYEKERIKQLTHTRKYSNFSKIFECPIEENKVFELNPVTYDIYKNQSGTSKTGAIHGYIYEDNKSYYFSCHGVLDVEKVYQEALKWDTVLFGKVTSIHSTEKKKLDWVCPKFKAPITPELTSTGYSMINIGISPYSLQLFVETESEEVM